MLPEDRGAEGISNLWSGSEEAEERAYAEVQWQPCCCAGPSVKAAGLSLQSQRRAISAMVCIDMLAVEISRAISTVFL